MEKQPHLKRTYFSDVFEEEVRKRSIIDGKSDGALYFHFVNIETNEEIKNLLEIDLETGEAILGVRINEKKVEGVTSFQLEYKFVNFDLSKYHIIFK
jgi:hypothetical protein